MQQRAEVISLPTRDERRPLELLQSIAAEIREREMSTIAATSLDHAEALRRWQNERGARRQELLEEYARRKFRSELLAITQTLKKIDDFDRTSGVSLEDVIESEKDVVDTIKKCHDVVLRGVAAVTGDDLPPWRLYQIFTEIFH